MYLILVMMALCISYTYAEENTTVLNLINSSTNSSEQPIDCACAIFLSGQFKKGSNKQPNGYPILLYEYPEVVPCNAVRNTLCTTKCLHALVKHLSNSAAILCASIDYNCHRERAYLFIKNCKDEWINTNISAGREYCCKNGTPYKCV